jgi:hypothetical protein
VICEAGGMVPQLARVAHSFGVTVMSGGGFDSTTDRHNFAAARSEHDRPTEVLHIGDHDPSGVSMFLAFLEDVEAFARELGGSAIFTRLAVTPAQIRKYRLPTAPPKATDNRAFSGQKRRSRLMCSPTSCAPPSRSASISAGSLACYVRSAAALGRAGC